MNTVSLFHQSLFLIILNSLFTDSLDLPSVFPHDFIQLFESNQNN